MNRLLPLLVLLPALLSTADPVEADYYKITTFETPKETALEVGSIELLPGGRLALGTRRGEVWFVSGAASGGACCACAAAVIDSASAAKTVNALESALVMRLIRSLRS